MTAHRPKPTITPDRLHWFARFVQRNCAWGYTFHVTLDDDNYELDAEADDRDWDNAAELEEAVAWFNQLTESQRARLGRKARMIAFDRMLCPCGICSAIRAAPIVT